MRLYREITRPRTQSPELEVAFVTGVTKSDYSVRCIVCLRPMTYSDNGSR
jgi:hypothetical protein